MSFPRAPKSSPKGVLQLIIRSPETEVTAESIPEDTSSLGDDVSNNIELKLPKWLIVDKDKKDVINRQLDAALFQLKGLREKREKCAVCRKRTSITALEVAEHLLHAVVGLLDSSADLDIRFLVGQLPDGTIELTFTSPVRELGFRLSAAGVELGEYAERALQKTYTYRYPVTEQVKKHLKWFVEG